ncbi:hypothetical protein F8M41_011813 [Gigaspora margarita]|uniref:Uncharacterized protein n=1 Tax=Gigaspora margarita TaxID=4874 RepID=A0A8H4A0A4_GIGMA|nr:hypothetical protein F8M41_011813 [Gigaspora margarita]
MPQEVHDIAQKLIENSKADTEKVNSLWRKASKARNTSPPPIRSSSPVSSPASSPASSSSILGKRQRDLATIDDPTKKQCVVPETSWFCSDMNVPLQANGGVNTLKIIK